LLDAHRDLFSASGGVCVARAPGRLDLMGGIADYSGSLVLQLPLAVATFAAAQWSNDDQIRMRPILAGAQNWLAEASVPLTDLADDYDVVRMRLAADPRARWVAYVAGAVTVLRRERGVRLPRGVRVLISSTVPVGKGVSSSAAIEVATMHALCGLLELKLEGRELALLCQKVENLVVGAPCGVMDQMTSACGEADSLLALLCQPAEIQAPVRLPSDVVVYGIDSNIRHEVSGADYRSVRVGAFMGYRIIADIAGLRVARDGARVRIDDPAWHGYLANVSPADWESQFRRRVPERMRGSDFLARYGGLTDTVTTVEPDRDYAIRQPTAHPIYEHDRVRRFRALLQPGKATDDVLTELGELMYQSHASYSACGLGSSGTDRIVDEVRTFGTAQGFFGAKITGGGSGGTVAVLARAGSSAPRTRDVLSGSSDGAIRWGYRTMDPQR
jgi:L-arabinokinase